MKHALIATLAVMLAAPVVSIPQPAEAQVLAGRNASGTRPRGVSPAQRRQARLNQAEDRLYEVEEKINELNTAGESAGGLTERQQQELARLTARRDELQRHVDRLNETM